MTLAARTVADDRVAAPRWPGTTGRDVVWGTLRIFAADALLLPTGVVTAAYLTRTLGPSGYGLYALAAAIVLWVEWTITSLFSRASLKLVAEADDWRAVGATVTWAHLVIGVVAGLLIIVGAGSIAASLGVPALARPLRLFALNVPVGCVAAAHRNLLVGVGRYGTRAAASAARVLLRMALSVALVAAGFSVEGAIVGVIVSSAVEVVVARTVVRPGWWRDPRFATRRLGELALPLFLYSAILRALDKIDVITLQRLGGSVSTVGVYAAAQNLSVAPGLFALALSSLLLTMLGRLLRDGDERAARVMARGAMRGAVLVVPYAALVAGGAPALVRTIFGPAFASAAPLVGLLIAAATAFVMLAVTTAILTAIDRAYTAVAIVAPVVAGALVGYVVVIPRLGATGAALVTASAAVLAALASVVAVHRVWHVAPHGATVVRSAIVGTAVFTTARWASSGGSGGWALAALALLALAIPPFFFAVGELTDRDLDLVRRPRP